MERNSKSAGCLALGLIVGMMLAYPLSIGPAAWANERGYVPDALGIVYVPLGYVCERCEWLDASLQWYMKLWGD